jgi:hypothetical protein
VNGRPETQTTRGGHDIFIHRIVLMASRFPTDEAPANASSIMEDALNVMHGGDIPFFWKEADGQFVGPYAPLA